jgi:hypothetical protein
MKKMDSGKIDPMLFKIAQLAEVDFPFGLTLFLNGVMLSGDTISTKEYAEILQRSFTKVASYEEVPENSKIHEVFMMFYDQVKNNFSGALGEMRESPVPILHLKDIRYRVGDTWSEVVDTVVRVKLDSVDGFTWASEI